MTYEEFQNASVEQLDGEAKKCFEQARESENFFRGLSPELLNEAQFYLQAIDRKESARIAHRDHVLEVWVIGLIGLEIVLALVGIVLAIIEGHSDQVLMDRQNAILTNLQTTSAATAETMKSMKATMETMGQNAKETAATLSLLKPTMEATNKGVHDQLVVFYDPAASLSFADDAKRLLFTNTGRTSLTITRVEIDGKQQTAIKLPAEVAPMASQYFGMDKTYDDLQSTLLMGQTKSIDVNIAFRNEQGKRFAMTSDIEFISRDGKFRVNVHTRPVVPVR
jgi:hypothetical protein